MLCFAWRRGALVAALGVVFAVGAGSAACGALGASENGGTSGSDGGTTFDGSSGGGDTGSSDGSVHDGGTDGAGDTGANRPTTALFVQGSPSLPDVRLCWGTETTNADVFPFPGDGVMPASNYPGIPLGGAASMGDASALATGGLTLYAIDAEVLARQDPGKPNTCAQLICGPNPNSFPCLRYNLDYWPVAQFGVGLQAGASNVVALGGCLPLALDPAATPARCGDSWTALSGNLNAEVFQLAPVVGGTVPGQLAVQAAQLSPGLATLAGDASSAVVSFGPQDAGDASVVATLSTEGDIEPTVPTEVAVGTSLAAFGSLGFAVDVPGLDGGTGHLWMSLAQAQQLVDPTQDPAQFFGQATTYVVAVIGDPSAPHAFAGGGTYDGKGLHLLVVTSLPSSPPPVGGEP
jgi:hypothetical protein